MEEKELFYEMIAKGNDALIKEEKFIVEMPEAIYKIVQKLLKDNSLGSLGIRDNSTVICRAISLMCTRLELEQGETISDKVHQAYRSIVQLEENKDRKQFVELMAKGNEILIKEGKCLIEFPALVYDVVRDLANKCFGGTEDTSLVICKAIQFAVRGERHYQSPSKEGEFLEPGNFLTYHYKGNEPLTHEEEKALSLLMRKGNEKLIESRVFIMDMPKEIYLLVRELATDRYRSVDIAVNESEIICEGIKNLYEKHIGPYNKEMCAIGMRKNVTYTSMND